MNSFGFQISGFFFNTKKDLKWPHEKNKASALFPRKLRRVPSYNRNNCFFNESLSFLLALVIVAHELFKTIKVSDRQGRSQKKNCGRSQKKKHD